MPPLHGGGNPSTEAYHFLVTIRLILCSRREAVHALFFTYTFLHLSKTPAELRVGCKVAAQNCQDVLETRTSLIYFSTCNRRHYYGDEIKWTYHSGRAV
jgi:hypothetical protein